MRLEIERTGAMLTAGQLQIIEKVANGFNSNQTFEEMHKNMIMSNAFNDHLKAATVKMGRGSSHIWFCNGSDQRFLVIYEK